MKIKPFQFFLFLHSKIKIITDMIKKWILYLLLMVFAGAGFAQSSSKDTLTIISFNIRQSAMGDDNNAWQKRKAESVTMIKMEKPSIFCLQEALSDQLSYLDKQLPNYQRIGIGRDDGKEGGEHMSIYYQKERYELLEHGDYWLSQTPDTVSMGWDAACHRIVTWGFFRDKQTNKTFYCFNTHLDHIGEVARRESVLLIVSKIPEIVKDSKAPIYLTGDFNSDLSSDIFLPLLQFMKPARQNAPITDNRGTFNGFGTAPNTIVIDHIFYKHSTPISFETLDKPIYGKSYISDHYPIKAKFIQ